jgi:ribonucleotide reductase alpha subunit
MSVNVFRNKFSEDIFNYKYRHEGCETWEKLAAVLVEDVCREWMTADEKETLTQAVATMKFIPGGRYIYYAGRPIKAFNNCYLLRAESDTREDWAMLSWKAESCLATGGGIGVDYSIYRPKGTPLKRTGGEASGPVSKMRMINEIGREVMQGGSRRSAIYASLNWQHLDIKTFLYAKDWHSMKVPGTDKTIWDCKVADFNYPAPLDMTNISANYDDAWLNLPDRHKNEVFLINCRQAMETGEPGWSFNFGDKQNETLRNACVPVDTRILTKDGYRPIGDLVGKEVEAWNGEEWSAVTPKATGRKTVYLVTLSNGASLRCSHNHEWILRGGNRVETSVLSLGDKLEKFAMPVIESGKPADFDAYTQGFYAGDGNDGYEFSWVYPPKQDVCARLKGSFYYEEGTNRLRWTHGQMLSKKFVPHDYDLQTRLGWLAGLLDADATINLSKQSLQIQLASIDFAFLREIQILLTTVGVCSSVTKMRDEEVREMPDGRGGLAKYSCAAMYRLHIGNGDVCLLKQLGLSTCRIDLSAANPDASRKRLFAQVVSVEELGEEDVFCFSEPKAHRGTFEGIVTGQCTEVTSEDDSDVCNLGSLNMSRIETAEEFRQIVELATKFLICGTMVADLPYSKVHEVRAKNRRLGLGLMGMHEWLVQRGSRYEVTDSLHKWLGIYRDESDAVAKSFSARLGISEPVAKRAIAPTGSIGILAGTTTGIEPVFAVAYKRRYLKNGTQWHYQYVVDSAAKDLIERYGVDPSKIESAIDLAKDYERRLKFQADTQDYVDQSISSTINMPSWGSELNNEDKIDDFALTLSKYAPRLRGFTVYPDGARGGQPLVSVDYDEAVKQQGVEYLEHDVCVIGGKGGTCGS